MKYPNGSTSYLTDGPWASLVKVTNVPCDDGVRRTIKVRAAAHAAMAIPGYTTVKGRTVSGVLSLQPEGFVFKASPHGKNAPFLTERTEKLL